MKLVPFGESIMFKIPKTSERTGKFEDRWESGCWVGFVMRTGEHLVATSRGVFRVSTIMRRPADQRWSETMIKEIKGSPEEPIPGMSGRRIPAYTKKYQQEPDEKAVYVPAQEPEVDPRKEYRRRTSMNMGRRKSVLDAELMSPASTGIDIRMSAGKDSRNYCTKQRRDGGDSSRQPSADLTQ